MNDGLDEGWGKLKRFVVSTLIAVAVLTLAGLGYVGWLAYEGFKAFEHAGL